MHSLSSSARRGGLLAVSLALLAACGGGGSSSSTPSSTPPVADPVIDSFTATPGALLQGDKTVLLATFHDGTGLVTPGNLAIASGTPLSLSPAANQTYTLTVTNSASKSVQKAADVAVLKPFRAAGGVTSAAGVPGSLSLRFAASGMEAPLVASPAATSGPAAGTLTLGGATIPLQGTFTTATGALALTGAGYSLAGTATFSGPPLASVSAVLTTTASGLPGPAALLPALTAGQASVSPTTSLPATRAGATASSLPDGRILIVGGDMTAAGSDQADALVWSPVSRTYAATGAMQVGARYNHRVVSHGGKVWVFGGTPSVGPQSSAYATAAVESWDPALNGGAGGFVARTPLNHARTSFVLVQVGSKVYCLGGLDGAENSVAAVEEYDMAGNGGAGSTRDVTSLLHPRYGGTGAALPDGRIMLIGGYTGPRVKDFVQRLANASNTSEILTPSSGAIAAGPVPPSGLFHGIAAVLGGRVLLYGTMLKTGATTYAVTGQTFWLDPAAGTWSAGPPMNAPRIEPVASGQLVDGSLVIAGGAGFTVDTSNPTGSPTELDTVEVLGPPDASGDPGSWKLLSTSLSGLRDNFSFTGGAVSTTSGEFLIPGGGTNLSADYVATADVVTPGATVAASPYDANPLGSYLTYLVTPSGGGATYSQTSQVVQVAGSRWTSKQTTSNATTYTMITGATAGGASYLLGLSSYAADGTLQSSTAYGSGIMTRPPDMSAGATATSYSTASAGTTFAVVRSHTVNGPESVTVPAGTFAAVKVTTILAQSNVAGTSTLVYWWVPGLGRVKTLTYPTGSPGSATTLELTAAGTAATGTGLDGSYLVTSFLCNGVPAVGPYPGILTAPSSARQVFAGPTNNLIFSKGACTIAQYSELAFPSAGTAVSTPRATWLCAPDAMACDAYANSIWGTNVCGTSINLRGGTSTYAPLTVAAGGTLTVTSVGGTTCADSGGGTDPFGMVLTKQ